MFDLPASTLVNRVIPKNAFDQYATTAQKKQFTDYVQKITWLNKLSTDTTNLQSIEIKEIQIFLLELKKKMKIDGVLSIIDKAIPYPIIFIIRQDSLYYVSVSSKRPHPLNRDNSIIDWTFKTDWQNDSDMFLNLSLKRNLDDVFINFCNQISRPKAELNNLSELVEYDKRKKQLLKEKDKLINAISSCKQFNKKVELNLQLKEIEKIINLLK